MTLQEAISRLQLHRSGSQWKGTCPVCGYRDALLVGPGRNGHPVAWCASCSGTNQAAITALVRDGEIPGGPLQNSRQNDEADAQRRTDAALSLWKGSVEIDRPEASPGRLYLTRRRLSHLHRCPALRYRPDTHHPSGGRYGALIALVQDHTSRHVAVHRTFINTTGGKAGVDPVKATLGQCSGAGVWLSPPAREMVIGEGLETSASAGLLFDLPAVAAISAGNMAHRLALPTTVKMVVIAADPDGPGEAAAATAAARWGAEGREVRIVRPECQGDFNDMLQAAGETNER